MLEILAEKFPQPVMFGVGPKVRVEPTQLVRGAAADRLAEDCLVGIQNRELLEEFFRFPQSVSLLENAEATDRVRRGCHKLDDRLMRHPDGILNDAASEDFRRDLAFFRKPAVETINQDIGINESGHARKGPLWPNLCRENAEFFAPAGACDGVPRLGQINGAAILDPPRRIPSLEE